jgi:AraC family transcriptional regulator, regulatory protein of adaptative response / methylated-DNA-[protein]-cysteine methyltransferase
MPQIRSAILSTPLGDMLAATVETHGREALCLLEFHDRRALPAERRDLSRAFGSDFPEPGAAVGVLAEASRQLEAYFARSLREFDLPLEFPGTPFCRQVWGELLKIPSGEVISYVELARRVGKPGGSRAVGQANGRNRIAIVIPCHRVIAADGTLGGYGGKLWRKERLLELEGATGHALFRAPEAAVV